MCAARASAGCKRCAVEQTNPIRFVIAGVRSQYGVALSPVQVDASLRSLERVWLRLRFELENKTVIGRALLRRPRRRIRRIRRIRYPSPGVVRSLRDTFLRGARTSTALHCVQRRVDEEEECFCFVCTHPPAPLSPAKPALATNPKAPRARPAHVGGSLSELAQELTSVTPPHLLLR